MAKAFLLGTGNMGSALLAGMLNSKRFGAGDIRVFDANAAVAQSAATKFGVEAASSPLEGLLGAQILILAMKPSDISAALRLLSPKLQPSHMIVSIAAGVTTSRIRETVGNDRRVVRVMPNTPGLIGAGITAIATDNASAEDLDLAEGLFRCIGDVVRVPEKLMDAVTGLSGSGPAYVYMFIESLIDGGIKAGLPMEVAKKLAIQTVIGSAKMSLESNENLAALRHRVTSPAGTTIAGCKVLEDKGFRSALIGAVEAAALRSAELSKSA